MQVEHQLLAEPPLNQELQRIFKLVNVRLKTEEYVVILKIEQTTLTGLETMGVPRLQTPVQQQITLMEPGEVSHLRKEFNLWNVHGIMNTSALLQS